MYTVASKTSENLGVEGKEGTEDPKWLYRTRRLKVKNHCQFHSGEDAGLSPEHGPAGAKAPSGE